LSSLRDQPPTGLRERKKAKTRAAIQAHALALFAAQGYDRTTVDEIAAAAEVSQSTFFRYFPTKEDVVLHDRYDPLMVAEFAAQPPELSPIAAVRVAVRSVLGSLPPAERAQEEQRTELIRTVPELRGRVLDAIAGTIEILNEALAERVGRSSDDPAVRALSGALIGVSISTMLAASQDPEADFFELLDESLAQLEQWVRL
jgi:AcrR family transcriptional regulator